VPAFSAWIVMRGVKGSCLAKHHQAVLSHVLPLPAVLLGVVVECLEADWLSVFSAVLATECPCLHHCPLSRRPLGHQTPRIFQVVVPAIRALHLKWYWSYAFSEQWRMQGTCHEAKEWVLTCWAPRPGTVTFGVGVFSDVGLCSVIHPGCMTESDFWDFLHGGDAFNRCVDACEVAKFDGPTKIPGTVLLALRPAVTHWWRNYLHDKEKADVRRVCGEQRAE
jgi:hypothetical protein